MSVYRQAVESAFEALRIDSPTGFSWFGEPSAPLPPETVAQMGAETARAYLCDRVQSRLYTGFYCAGRAVPPPAARTVGRPHANSDFIDSLSRANRGKGSHEAGWKVLREEEDGRFVVQREGLSVWADPRDVRGGGAEGKVSVRLPAELLRLSPGFFMALGNEEVDNEEPFVRHYWHLGPGGGPALIAAATEALNEAGLPFRLKVLIDPDTYSRRDAGVLYTPRRLREEVAGLLPALRARVAAHLRPGAPALTKPLAEGLGVAEDPPGGRSFGMDRCGLLAEAMVRAFERGLEGGEERLALVAQCFGDRGISFERPYLNAGSKDDYEVLG